MGQTPTRLVYTWYSAGSVFTHKTYTSISGGISYTSTDCMPAPVRGMICTRYMILRVPVTSTTVYLSIVLVFVDKYFPTLSPGLPLPCFDSSIRLGCACCTLPGTAVLYTVYTSKEVNKVPGTWYRTATLSRSRAFFRALS